MTIYIVDHDFSNKTKYGIESDALRNIWAGFYFFLIFSSLIGDPTILVASIKYKVIKLHRVIVTVIQHLAVCDLLVIASDASPRFITIIANRWVFGQFLCNVFSFTYDYINTVSIFLICTMTALKLLLVKYPLRFGTTSSRKSHMLCGSCWGIPLIIPVTMLLVNWRDVHFSYLSYSCAYGYSSSIWKYVLPLLSIFSGVPIIMVVGTSVNLLVIAKKVASSERGGLKWQGITTTILTAAALCVSWLPWIVVLALDKGMEIQDSETINDNRVTYAFLRLAVSFVSLNTMSNFYIYCLTVTSFRNFVWYKLKLFSQIFAFSRCRGTNSLFVSLGC